MTFEDDLRACLSGNGLNLTGEASASPEWHVHSAARGHSWRLDGPLSEWEQRAVRLDAGAREAGVGGRGVAPGLALLGIHIEEAVATAASPTSVLHLTDSGVAAR